MADDERDLAEPEDGPARLSPDEIAFRSFSGARRGISEPEVREFLREVAAEMVDLGTRAQDTQERLEARVAELTEQVARPPRPTEDQILAAFGEETARVLRSAQEAAEDIKANASARTEGLITQAEAEAARLREAAERVLAERSREADVAAAVRLQEAEGQARAQGREAARDAEAEIEAARQRGREMVGEARAVRERILADLGKRRATLQAEVTQLEAAREQLLSAGRVVKRTLADAAQALSPFEVADRPEAVVAPPPPRAPTEPAARPRDTGAAATGAATDESAPAPAEPEPPRTGLRSYLRRAAHTEEPDRPAERATEPEPAEPEPAEPEPAEPEPAPSADAASPDGPSPDAASPDDPAEPAPPEPSEPPPTDAERARPGAGPGAEGVFARLRAQREQAVGAARAVLEVAPEPEDAPVEPAPMPEPAPTTAAPGDGGGTEARDAELLARRDEILAPVAQELVRKCKRALQDEQNELLDRLRRQRGRADGESLLVPLSVQVTDWADVLEPAVDEAYGAGRGSQLAAGHDGVRVPRRLVSGLAEVLVRPLRERLLASIDAAPGDPGPEREAELSTRVGARYREWRAQELDLRVGDVLAAAFVRGVFDAAPDGSELCWIPAEVGRCPDADDNALEPTARGARFPTGQAFPPAHPGCRCLIAIGTGD